MKYIKIIILLSIILNNIYSYELTEKEEDKYKKLIKIIEIHWKNNYEKRMKKLKKLEKKRMVELENLEKKRKHLNELKKKKISNKCYKLIKDNNKNLIIGLQNINRNKSIIVYGKELVKYDDNSTEELDTNTTIKKTKKEMVLNLRLEEENQYINNMREYLVINIGKYIYKYVIGVNYEFINNKYLKSSVDLEWGYYNDKYLKNESSIYQFEIKNEIKIDKDLDILYNYSHGKIKYITFKSFSYGIQYNNNKLNNDYFQLLFKKNKDNSYNSNEIHFNYVIRSF